VAVKNAVEIPVTRRVIRTVFGTAILLGMCMKATISSAPRPSSTDDPTAIAALSVPIAMLFCATQSP
jgi:hypothetical protein